MGATPVQLTVFGAMVRIRVFTSQGRTHFASSLFQLYPAPTRQPWASLSPPIGFASTSHSHCTISVACAAFAIQLFPNVCFTGLQGAFIHCTCTDPHTGAYSIVHIVGVSAETDCDNPRRNIPRILTTRVFILRKRRNKVSVHKKTKKEKIRDKIIYISHENYRIFILTMKLFYI